MGEQTRHPAFRKPSPLVYCSALAILKFLIVMLNTGLPVFVLLQIMKPVMIERNPVAIWGQWRTSRQLVERNACQKVTKTASCSIIYIQQLFNDYCTC